MVYFDDLFRSGDFHGALAELSRPVREALAFPSLHQLGIVVPDVEQTAAVLEEEGFGPFFIARGAPVFWHEKGRARQVAGKMGLAYHGGIEIELLEPLEGSSFYHHAIDPSGRPVVQHLGFLVDDVDAWAKSVAEGTLPVMRGVALDDDDRLRRYAIQRLMCDGELDWAAVEARFDVEFEAYFADELQRLRGEEYRELVVVDDASRQLVATPLGCNLIRNVAMVFDRYLSQPREGPRPRFSPTV